MTNPETTTRYPDGHSEAYRLVVARSGSDASSRLDVGRVAGDCKHYGEMGS